MSGKSKRPGPRQRARMDQLLAQARDWGANDPRTAVHATEYADPGVQCCWCDCTLEQHQAFGNCGGCPAEAAYVNHLYLGTPAHTAYPVCEGHQQNFLKFSATMTAAAHPGVPLQVISAEDDEGNPGPITRA